MLPLSPRLSCDSTEPDAALFSASAQVSDRVLMDGYGVKSLGIAGVGVALPLGALAGKCHRVGAQSRLMLALGSANLMCEPMQRAHQHVDFSAGVIEGERRSNGGLEAESAQDRLRAMMAGAYRNALAIQRRTDFLGTIALKHE